MGGDTAPVNNHSVHCDFWFTGQILTTLDVKATEENCNSGISVLYGRHDLLELFFIDGQQYGKHIYNKQFYYGKGIFSKAGISGSVNHI